MCGWYAVNRAQCVLADGQWESKAYGARLMMKCLSGLPPQGSWLHGHSWSAMSGQTEFRRIGRFNLL